MKEVVVFLTVYGMVLMPLYANAEASRSARAVANAAAPPISSVSLLEAAETAAASGRLSRPEHRQHHHRADSGRRQEAERHRIRH